ncbi:hypothetical protein [Niastella koreensis]|nr:hypothetical protein [Niastella koreensis]
MSDNPIIYRTPGYESLDAKDFIFPLSPTYMLFRHRTTRITVNPLIRVLLDMLFLVQANEYVSCVSKEYPQQLYNAFQKDFSSSIDRLREEVFSCIHDSSTIQRGSRL